MNLFLYLIIHINFINNKYLKVFVNRKSEVIKTRLTNRFINSLSGNGVKNGINIDIDNLQV